MALHPRKLGGSWLAASLAELGAGVLFLVNGSQFIWDSGVASRAMSQWPEKYEDPKIRVTRLEACRRQLEAAAWLYAEDRDEVATFALVANAHEMLAGLSGKTGGRVSGRGKARRNLEEKPKMPILAATTGKGAPREKDEALAARIAYLQGFIKHAGKDRDEFVDLSPGLTELLFYGAGWTLQVLAPPLPAIVHAGMSWFMMKNAGWQGDQFWISARERFTGMPKLEVIRQLALELEMQRRARIPGIHLLKLSH